MVCSVSMLRLYYAARSVADDGDIVDLQPGVAVGPQAGVDDEAGAIAGRNGDRELRVAAERGEVLLADDLTVERAQPEVAGRVVRRRPEPARDRVGVIRRDRDDLMDIVPAAGVAHPAVAGAAVRQTEADIRTAVAEALPGVQAGLEPAVRGDIDAGRRRRQRRRLQHGQHARQRIVEREVPA